MKVSGAILKLTLVVASAACALNTCSADAPTVATIAPTVLPGQGPAQHPFLYAGEWDTRKPQEQSIFIVREGKIVWQYSMPIRTAERPESGVRRRHAVVQWQRGLLTDVGSGNGQPGQESFCGIIPLRPELKSTRANPSAKTAS